MSPHDPASVSRMRDLSAEPIDWLWPERLAAGKLSLLDGDPSQGKSLVSLDLASRFTTAAPLPDGYRPSEPISVVLIGAEDDVQDTTIPRLQAAGADPERIHFFHGRKAERGHVQLPTFPDDCDLLEEVLRTI